MPYNQIYQPYYQQQMPQQYYAPMNAYNAQISPQNNSMVNLSPNNNQAVISPKFDVVQGELAANMYQTENGQEVILMDMDNPYVYKKRRGLDGKLEPIEKYKLVKEEETPVDNLKDYVRQEELQAIIENIVKNEVEKKLSDITLKPTRKKGEE